MAYPVVSAPYGLVPVNRLDGMPYAGAVRHYSIASAYATSIFKGDAVKLVTGGTIERETADAAMVVCGVFMGCEYTDPVLGYKIQSNYFPAGTTGTDIKAYVVDDPNAVFKVAVVSGTTVISSIAAGVGSNAAMVDNTGVVATGMSRTAIDDTVATTATLPLRIVELVEETKNAAGEYTEALVKWNVGHQFASTTGVAPA